MKKIIIALFFVLLILPISYGNFWESHDWMNEQALLQPFDSYYKNLIMDGRDNIFDGCNAGADATVIWYLSAKTQKKYQQSHVKRAYEMCNYYAGDDPDLKVCCLGLAAHDTQDPYTSHGIGDIKGYTPMCIEKYWGSNILMHAACENAQNDQLLDSLSTFERERLILLAGNAYDIFQDPDRSHYDSNGNIDLSLYSNKYAELLAKSFGFTSTDQKQSFFNAIFIVGDFVKSGQGSGYIDMYKNYRDLPTSWTLVPIIVLLVAAFGIFFALKYGINKWKWALVSVCGTAILFLVILLISVLTGKAYIWYKSFATFLPTIIYGVLALIALLGFFISLGFKNTLKYVSLAVFLSLFLFSGYILVSTSFGRIYIDDYRQYLDKGVQETVTLLQTGQMNVLDSSGLNYYVGNDLIEGSLIKAQSKFQFVQWIFVGALGFLLTVLVIQMRKRG